MKEKNINYERKHYLLLNSNFIHPERQSFFGLKLQGDHKRNQCQGNNLTKKIGAHQQSQKGLFLHRKRVFSINYTVCKKLNKIPWAPKSTDFAKIRHSISFITASQRLHRGWKEKLRSTRETKGWHCIQ